MIQEMKCSNCGINGADTDLIAIPMSFICQSCYNHGFEAAVRIKELERELAYEIDMNAQGRVKA